MMHIVQWRHQLTNSTPSVLWKNDWWKTAIVASCDRAAVATTNRVRTLHRQRTPSHPTKTTTPRAIWTLESSLAPSVPWNNTSSTAILIIQRWKHAGKMGHHLEKLDEIAHRPEREAAQERRNKKKEKKAAKKTHGGKSNKAGIPVENDDALDDDETVHAMTGLGNKNYIDDDDRYRHDDEDGHDDGNDYNEDGDAEPTLPSPDRIKERMMAIVERFQESLKSIRGAEPTAEMFDDVQVNAYGSMTPLKAVGQVVIVSHTLATIACFDPAVARDVQRAIQLTLELNPQLDEGGMVRVPLPRVSMEVREQTSRQLHKMAEACRQRLRQVRRRAMDVVKKGKDGKMAGISKDDAFATGKEIEQVTEDVMETLKQMVDAKMNSIMAV
jgi:ribosome recycling factor